MEGMTLNHISLLIGNGCSLLAMFTDSVSTTQKTTKRILLTQCVSQVIYCIGTAALKGYSGAVQNIVSILRNLFAIREKPNRFVEWGLILLGVALGLVCNNMGVLGLLPTIANLQYALIILKLRQNEALLKGSFLLHAAMFAVYNGALYNLVGIVTNSIVVITTAISLVKCLKK